MRQPSIGVRLMSLTRLFSDFDGRIGLRAFWLGSLTVALTLFAIQRVTALLADHDDARVIVAFASYLAWFWLLQRGYHPRQLDLSCPIAIALQKTANGDINHHARA